MRFERIPHAIPGAEVAYYVHDELGRLAGWVERHGRTWRSYPTLGAVTTAAEAARDGIEAPTRNAAAADIARRRISETVQVASAPDGAA